MCQSINEVTDLMTGISIVFTSVFQGYFLILVLQGNQSMLDSYWVAFTLNIFYCLSIILSLNRAIQNLPDDISVSTDGSQEVPTMIIV